MTYHINQTNPADDENGDESVPLTGKSYTEGKE